jgi:hypothetical protein
LPAFKTIQPGQFQELVTEHAFFAKTQSARPWQFVEHPRAIQGAQISCSPDFGSGFFLDSDYDSALGDDFLRCGFRKNDIG